MSTITCQQTRREISELLDGGHTALPVPAGEHVESCGDCREFFDDSRALDSRLAQEVPVPTEAAADLPEGFHARVLAAAQASSETEKVVGFPRWLMPAAGVAAAAALVALAVWKGDKPGDTETPIVAVNNVPPAIEEVIPGLPTGFESPVDLPAMTAVASRGMETAFGREAEALAADMLKVRDFFTSRVTVVSRIGL